MPNSHHVPHMQVSYPTVFVNSSIYMPSYERLHTLFVMNSKLVTFHTSYDFFGVHFVTGRVLSHCFLDFMRVEAYTIIL